MKLHPSLSSGHWHAVATIRLDRPRGLTQLERAFAEGEIPEHLDGPLRGRLVATTFGHGLDGPFKMMARAWMPWRGKTVRR